jgi:CRISPR-associated endonuclease Csn1
MGGSREQKDKENPEKYYGKINNPTVHIALNQLRKLVNEIIRVYGRPDEVVIELARDLKEPADEINKQQAQNKKENDRINKCLETLGIKQNYRNRMLFKLWEDLAKDPAKRCCPFSGIQIGERTFSLESSRKSISSPFRVVITMGEQTRFFRTSTGIEKKETVRPMKRLGTRPSAGDSGASAKSSREQAMALFGRRLAEDGR